MLEKGDPVAMSLTCILRRPSALCCMVAVLASGCAGRAEDRIIVDTKGVDPGRYAEDLGECAEYAGLVDVEGRVLASAAGSAVLYGVLGAILDDGDTAERTAGAGAVFGGVRGGFDATREQERIIRNCLSGRGYRVLN